MATTSGGNHSGEFVVHVDEPDTHAQSAERQERASDERKEQSDSILAQGKTVKWWVLGIALIGGGGFSVAMYLNCYAKQSELDKVSAKVDAQERATTISEVSQRGMNVRLDKVDVRFDKLDGKFDKLDGKLDDLNLMLTRISTAVGAPRHASLRAPRKDTDL